MSKYPRTYHLPWSEGTTNDDKKADDISNVIGNRIIITEKLDGENCGIEKGGVYARSHATYTDSPWSIGVRQVHSMVNAYLDEGIMLFGENMEGIHSIEYDKLTTHFYMFGIMEGDYFIDWEGVEFYSKTLEVQTVPYWFDGVVDSEEELKELVDDIISQPSKLGGKDIHTGKKQMEGVVVRTWDGFHIDKFSENVFKLVRPNHVQTDEHWTKNWKRANIIW